MKVQRGTRCSCTVFFFNLGTTWGWEVKGTPRPLYLRETPGTHSAGGWVISPVTGIRYPDRQSCSESLNSVRYPGRHAWPCKHQISVTSPIGLCNGQPVHNTVGGSYRECKNVALLLHHWRGVQTVMYVATWSPYWSALSPANTGRFVMFSVITNIHNKKIKGPKLMELFCASGKV
jgi:hypothetical protein